MRTTGIDVIGSVPWGAHFCQFYEGTQDLIDILVPYFAAGLQHNEFCMWVTSEPLGMEEAKAALAKVVGDLAPYFRSGQLEILDHTQWHTLGGEFEADRVLQGWVDKLVLARERGFDGLRLTGNTFWLEQSHWRDFTEYEAAVDSVIGRYPMLAICTYSLAECGAPELLDVMANHAFALIKRGGTWQVIESAERKRAESDIERNEARLESLLRISQYRAGTTQELLDFALNEAITLTDSKIGYIYHYDDTREEFTLNTWSREVMQQCTVRERQTVYELEKTGIWGEAVRQASPIIVNDFQAPHPLKKGYPDGHAPLHRYMTVPVLSDDRIVGVVGVANKDTDYESTDVRQLVLLMDSAWKITERKQAEQERERLLQQVVEAERERAAIAERMTVEINHRMKNNLTLLSSVLQLQLSALPPGSVASGAIQDAISRIGSLSVVHEQLYEGAEGRVELCDVLRRVGQIGAHTLAVRDVALSVSGEACYVSSKLGSTVAILANELVTNALKHGAPAEDGRLHVSIDLARRDTDLRLSIWNSNNPVPADFDPTRQPGIGLALVRGVVIEQLGGSFTIRPERGGTLAEVAFGDDAANPLYGAEGRDAALP